MAQEGPKHVADILETVKGFSLKKNSVSQYGWLNFFNLINNCTVLINTLNTLKH